jgi:tetratricopeptide (TPR) repeat protein
MNVGLGESGKVAKVAGCLFLALQMSFAQNAVHKAGVPNSPQATRALLAEKAVVLEARGRPDLSIQLWQQILLSDPNNVEALAGLAKDLKLTGSDKAIDALERLRKISPNNPEISKIQGMASTRAESAELRHAGELARQGKVEDAMRIYKQLYGDHPPDGDIALSYYQTIYGTASGKQEAISGMRALAGRNPGDPRFSVELGKTLTYDQKTRAEGIRILNEHPKDLNAQAALRQALLWDAQNPWAAPELRAYLKQHPEDAELSNRLKEDETKLAQMNSGIARTPAERAAFAALNAKHLDEAEKRFTAILDEEPDNGRVAAGMGFLRMQQNNFGDAVTYLERAEANGFKDHTVVDALANSQFGYVMSQASQAFNANQLDVAGARYREALELRPRSPEALIGLAGLLSKQQQYAGAALMFDQLVKAQPNSTDGWRGLFLAYARDNQNDKALAVQARFPAPVKTELAKDPDYLRTLAEIYQAENRTADAEHVLAQAMDLPYPQNGATLKTDTKLEYAGILMDARRYDQAVTLYTQMLSGDPGNLPAWMGLVSALHGMGQDTQAINEVQKMPSAIYESALADSGFLSMLGAIYQQANQFEVAQGLLERSAKLQIAAGSQPSVTLQLQLAGIYLHENDTSKAYGIYHQVLETNPDRADAWKGLIAALQATDRNSEALQEIALIPAPVRKDLDTDIEFVQTEASLYAATGDSVRATEYMNRVQEHYAKLHAPMPAAIEIRNAWLLFNTQNDRALYAALMRLGSRTGLTVAQRETIQNIWAEWSVRRAAAAMDNGNLQRSVDILDAASQAFPDNLTVRKAVAGGHAQVGRAKESLALYKTIPMQDATAGDFQGAVGAALAANDKAQAELWLRQALERFPRDPAILEVAGRYEQARGDNQRAADYYRASIAAMPSASPADKLAHELVYPDQDTSVHRAVTAADLQRLLDPNNEPVEKTTKIAPLPAYGPDPYNGATPAAVAPTHPLPQAAPNQSTQSTEYQAPPQDDAPQIYPPSANHGQSSPAPVYVPQSWNRHSSSAPHLMYATLQVKNRDRLHSAGYSYFRTASFTRAGPAAHAALAQTQTPSLNSTQPVQLSANPPRSQASDAWKGLVFSLMAGNRNAEALDEIARIPPDVRHQLEADIEFAQVEAGLYISVGDISNATEYLTRVENFYLLRRSDAPASLEVQHAWLLYNANDERALYPVLARLDARADLTSAQREQVQTLWANFAVRRAEYYLNNGYQQRGVQLLQAASEDYPSNMTVRKAIAGAYAKVGRAVDALALYNTIPMQDAAPADYQGAIGAALAATDMAQAESWLRLALSRYPNDSHVLGLAARFEQARGNTQRAADFWRASLAAMPPGASAALLDSALVPPSLYATPAAGELKRLLDPRADPAGKGTTLPPVPAYGPNNSVSQTPINPIPLTPLVPIQKPSSQWIQQPSSYPLPLPAGVGSAPSQIAQTGAPLNSPQGNPPPGFVPQIAAQHQPSQPLMFEQSSRQPADIKPADSKTGAGAHVHTGNTALPPAGNQSPYMGKMHVPPSEETIATAAVEPGPEPQTTSGSAPAAKPQSTPPPTWPTNTASAPTPAPPLRISSRPMGPVAAQAQALFADQTDGQLTQGSASVIHTVPNASVGPLPSLHSAPPAVGQYNVAQYTPSAQQAATGAYSAPKQQQQPTPPSDITSPPAAKPAKPAAATPARKKRKPATAQPGLPTLEQAPASTGNSSGQAPQQVTALNDVPASIPAPTTDTGLTDDELQQRNLPPLRGPWVRIQRQSNPISPRDEAEMQLHSIEAGYSPWIGGTGLINYRSGSLGYDHLAALEAPYELSMPLGFNTRLTVVAKPVFLDSGQADGTSVITVQESTTAGAALVSIPQPIGTLTATATTLPAQQSAVGVGGELQLAFPHLALAGGYTPSGFLVATATGRAYWKPGNGPFTLNFSRDPVRDTQLSYSGLRDPAGNTLGNPGQIWGGVTANQGQVQFRREDAESGFYLSAGGQYLTGNTVQNNTRIDGSGGAWWHLKTMPEYGDLSIGANFFGMHYEHNENALTHGMGGYFSPQAYFLADIPFTWVGHYNTRWHYNILGSLGVQAFQQDLAPLWPLAVDKALETAMNNAMLPAKTSVGPNYDVRGNVSYQIGSHWFAGGFLSANNTRNYAAVCAGFSIHYMFRTQPSTAAGPTGIFPSDGVRPFSVP